MKFPLGVGNAYDLALLGASTLGSGYRQATLVGILDYNSAISLGDVASTHASVLGSLAIGTPSDPSKLLYLKFRTSTGDIVVLAQDWLAGAPTDATVTSVVVTIDNVATSDIERIRNMLTANGFTSFSIE
jgi:hypothetical protein